MPKWLDYQSVAQSVASSLSPFVELFPAQGMYNRSPHLERSGMQESFKESHVMDPGKEIDKNGDKK